VLVVSVANLRANKDHGTLLAAAVEATRRDPALRFVAVGQGPLEVALRARLEELGLGERFRFLGYQHDPVPILAAADVFTLSSRHEGLPIALLEAMALGVPSVLTAVGGVPSVVTHGREALLVPPGDPDALARAYLELAADPGARVRLGQHALERVGHFDIAVAARRIELVYASLAGGAASG
jgi:glycosyltransferase involved in cell wall biosynthesis